MISPRKVCFVYFALLFGMAHASKKVSNANQSVTATYSTSTTSFTNTSAKSYSEANPPEQSPVAQTSTTACIQPTTEERICILYLTTDQYTLIVTVIALILGCLALLLIMLICACQVCHLRGIISSLQPRYDNTDRHARKEKRSESPCQEEGQEDRHPTETSFMLSEVTTAQEESREVQEKKTEEEYDTEKPSIVNDQNGDIAQEKSPEPDAKAP